MTFSYGRLASLRVGIISARFRRGRPHSVLTRSALLLVLLGSAAGCGGSPTGPSGSGAVQVSILFIADGAFSATFRGTTITAQGVHTFNLNPGTYQISGQMRTTFLDVAFARVTGSGGVVSGSVRASSGPAPQAGQCNVSFLTFAPPQPFSVSFTVSTVSANACQGP